MLDLFHLPGPHKFIDTVASSLMEGRNVVVDVPEDLPVGLFDSIAQVLSEYYPWRRVKSEIESSDRPCTALEEAYLGDALLDRSATPYDIARIPQIQGVIYHVVPGAGLAQAWLDFLGEYQSACKELSTSERPLFCLQLGRSTSRTVKEDVCLSYFRWNAVISLNDMRYFAESFYIPFNGPLIIRKIITELAVQLSTWDTILCQELLTYGIELALKTQEVLFECLRDFKIIGDSNEDLFRKGLLDDFDTEKKKHISVVLHIGEAEELILRIWKAELIVLMPFIEEERIRLIKEIGTRLRIPHEVKDGLPIENPLDLEYGHLKVQIEKYGVAVTQNQRSRILLYCAIRNKLAHLEPIESFQLHELIRLTSASTSR